MTLSSGAGRGGVHATARPPEAFHKEASLFPPRLTCVHFFPQKGDEADVSVPHLGEPVSLNYVPFG